MKMTFVCRFFASIAAVVCVGGGAASAQSGGEFIVASQVVSDTVRPARAHVGDLDNAVKPAAAQIGAGCLNGDCGSSVVSDHGASCSGGSCSGEVIDGGVIDGGIIDGGEIDGGSIVGGCMGRQYDRSDLFYNYFSKGNCNQANAQMYVSPLPVPPFVGHTFNTYQPLYPHHFLYRHADRYHNHYDNGRGTNRTRVKYSYPVVRTAMSNLYWNKIRIPR